MRTNTEKNPSPGREAERFGLAVKAVRNIMVLLAASLIGFGFAQDDEAPDGEAFFMQSCAGCLMNVVMWGRSGEVTSLGEVFDRSMPPRFTLANDELAAILNHVMTSWGNADLIEGEFQPYDADELTAVRRTSREWAIQFRPAIDPEL